MTVITSSRQGDVLVVAADNPPVNALGAAVRQALARVFADARQDDRVKALVILASGRTFFAGADIEEFGKPMQEPALPELVALIEGSAKPVVAAIHGTALGGGLEVALGCHYRVAVASAKLGLPEVKLGIIPGAGGTQRLPRVIGVEAALAMIASGEPVTAARARELGLVDRIVDEDRLEAAAVAFAREIAGADRHPISSAGRAAADPAVFARFRADNARRFKNLDAPAACIDAVEASTLPFAQGIARERELFMRLLDGGQSKALRHLFLAERAAAKIDGVPADVPLIPIVKVGILGAVTMGGGIAMNFMSAGIPVTLLEREQAPLDRGLAIIRRNYEATARKGRMTREQVERAMSLLVPTLSFDDLADCDLVIEAVFEQMDVKKAVFARLDGVLKGGAILASNTSFLDIDEIASVTQRPEHVLGLHFFSPANVMRLLEVVRGARTSPAVVATAVALAKKIRKIAVVAGVCHGFIGNRMLERRQDQANALLLEGATVQQVDQVLLDFGFPMGPFQLADLAGLDIGWDPESSSGTEELRDMLCEAGLRGQKNGHGFYDYDDARNRTPSADVDGMVRDLAIRRGIVQRRIDGQEILERLLYTMVNEGALILEEGKAQRASDIDVVWLNGYGWPAWTGGPMYWANRVGLDAVVAGLERHAPRMAGFRLAPLLADKAAGGGSFTA